MKEERISKMAVASLILVGLTIAGWFGLQAESGLPKTNVTEISGVAVLVGPIAGFVSAFLALLWIKASRGALGGKLCAVAGLILASILLAYLVFAGNQHCRPY
jgi:sugar phosphate permease